MGLRSGLLGWTALRAGLLANLVLLLALVACLPTATTPRPTSLPKEGQGTIYGRVSIGPLCPVEPCPGPTPDVYSSRALALQPERGQTINVKLNPDGSFRALVNAGTYTVSLTDCAFLGCRGVLPRKVTIAPNEATLLEIDIDTGIR